MKAAINFSTVLSLFFTLGVSSVALATTYQDVPSSQLQSYKEGVWIALEKNSVHCVPWAVYQHVREAQKVKLELEGGQPILVFEYVTNQNTGLSVTRIVSSPDYREIKSVRIDHYDWNNTNQGTLREPQIVKAWVHRSTDQCGETK
jgi:hypothetical protein